MLSLKKSVPTVCKHLTLLKTAMQDALVNDLIKSNPAYKVKPPKKEKSRHDFYKVEEMKNLLTVSRGTPIEVPVFLAIFVSVCKKNARNRIVAKK